MPKLLKVSRGVIFFELWQIFNWKDPLKYVFLFPNGIAGRLGVNIQLLSVQKIFFLREKNHIIQKTREAMPGFRIHIFLNFWKNSPNFHFETFLKKWCWITQDVIRIWLKRRCLKRLKMPRSVSVWRTNCGGQDRHDPTSHLKEACTVQWWE